MKIYEFDAAVIGSGAAGYNAACRLKQLGKNAAIITEGVNCGTSRNTGSDKQTYYKLGLGSDSLDSARQMAENLFAGGSVDGDNAMCEAALSTRCFMNLCELGVEFPTNRYGEYIGYKTDHDPYARATSAGPLTSKHITEALQKNAERLGVDIIDGALAVEILKDENRVCGVLCLDIEGGSLFAVKCSDVIVATGGPAGIYADSVYPECHSGSTALALCAGAKAQSLTEWQYGLASINPRWNVSGTYMQVLPRFVSVDSNGNEHEFLKDLFSDIYEALNAVFLKGYQWPFDSKKVLGGSSVIDLLVYRERVLRGRRVYLDFTKNPFGLHNIEYDRLSKEAYDYLSKADALFGTPIQRLIKMNSPAVDLYSGKGVDITKDYLEIALCAQHNNGGISVDMWWQTCVRGLFAAGECAGTHGIARPGGSALNAGQVGSLRAAQFIAAQPNGKTDLKRFEQIIEDRAAEHEAEIGAILSCDDNAGQMIADAQRKMSDFAAAIRNKSELVTLLSEVEDTLDRLLETVAVKCKSTVYAYYKLKDILITQQAVLSAMIDYADAVGQTRGSSLCFDEKGDLRQGLEEIFRFTLEQGDTAKKVQQTYLSGGKFRCEWRDVRPLPESGGFFEQAWRTYRENGNIY